MTSGILLKEYQGEKMAVRKIAISVPENVLRQVDRMAKKSKMTRSGLITHLLKEVSHAASQADIVSKINQLFDDNNIIEEQASTANFFLQAGKKYYKDSDW